MGEGVDPRKAERFEQRVLQPKMQWCDENRMMLGYQTTTSKMTLGMRRRPLDRHRQLLHASAAKPAKTWPRSSIGCRPSPGQTIKLSKAVVYHTSRGVPVKELSDRCRRTLDRVAEVGIDQQFVDQRAWMDAYWARCDVEIPGQPEVQQAVRWNLFQLAQAAGRAEGMGIPAKGVSGSGYGGHYFWDTEVYVMPFLTYTSPMLARNALRFRYGMLPAAEAAGQGPAARRGAVPVAHDQRRGGVGLLRRRHRAVPHRRRHLLCAEQVCRRDR